MGDRLDEDASTDRGVQGAAPRPRRGPKVTLRTHPKALADPAGLPARIAELRRSGRLTAADLFCGAGGLSLGLEQAGFTVVVGVDHDADSLQTHAHHFGGLTLDWDLADPVRVEGLGALLSGVDLIAGGPPCQPFSKAGRSLIRDLVRSGRRPAKDARADLWQSFLRVIAIARPRAVLMENVPDMALDRDQMILRTMTEELESLGYNVTARILEARRFGVPQYRERLILVAVLGKGFRWPDEAVERVTTWDAIGDLPEVEGGFPDTDDAIPYGSPITAFQQHARELVGRSDSHRIYDHYTRAVRPDDAKIFASMDHTTKYTDIAQDLKRYRDDIFTDKYKRLDPDDFSRTITAHLAKDGYWYIHPRQDRTLTVREAARIQTFPDHFRFAGTPTSAFRQIGNAVPPTLGRHLGLAISAALVGKFEPPPMSTDTSTALASWHEASRSKPWRRSGDRWRVLAGEVLYRESDDEDYQQLIWEAVVLRFAHSPQATVVHGSGELRERLRDRKRELDKLVSVAERVEAADDLTESRMRELGVDSTTAGIVLRAAPTGDEDPVITSAATLRLAARFARGAVDADDAMRIGEAILRRKGTDGRIAVGMLVGADDSRETSGQSRATSAHLGLITLAESVCRNTDPACDVCALQPLCWQGRENDEKLSLLRLRAMDR